MEPRSVRRGLLVTVAVAVAVLLAGEVGVRALAPYLPEPLLWHDRATQVKVRQMDDLAQRYGCVPVVFVGNSMTRDALDPAVFADADPAARRAYNAALDAATPALLERWVTEEVVPRLHPETVVLGLSSFDLNDNARIAAAAVEAYEEAPLSRADLWGRLQAPFLHSSSLFRYRTELRDPETLWQALRRMWRGEEAPRDRLDGIPGVLGRLGQGLSRRDLVYTGRASTQAFVRDQLLDGYATRGTQRHALLRLVGELQDRDIEVVLAVLPVTPDYVAAHPDGSIDMEGFVASIEEVAAETGAAFLDLRALVEDTSAFADTHHLNGSGSERLSRTLPGLLPPAHAGGCA